MPRNNNENNAEEDDSASSPDTGQSRGRSTFLRRKPGHDGLFQRMFESDDQDNEDDDSKEKKAKRFSKFRKPFRKLFRKGIVAPPEHITGAEEDSYHNSVENNESVVPFNNFGDWLRKMSARADEDDSHSQVKEVIPSSYEGLPAIPASEVVRAGVTGRLEYEADDAIDANEENQDAPTLEAIEDATEDDSEALTMQESTPVISAPESVQQILARQASSSYEPAAANGIVAEEQSSHIVNNITNETYVNNTSWGPALVVDQLSRHRDRKIKKINKRQDKTIDNLKSDQNIVGADQRRSNERTESFKLQNEDFTKQEIQRNNEAIVPLARPSEMSVNPEKFVPYIADRRKDTTSEQIQTAVNIEKNTTEKMYKRTIEMAEKPSGLIEMEHEKRHEIKDSRPYREIAEGAFVARAPRLYEVEKSIVLNDDPRSDGNPVQKINQNNSPPGSMYKQAAKGGAVVAVLFLVAFLVIYIVSS